MPDLMEATKPASRKLRFGVFEVDPRSGELRKQGVRIPLQRRPFQALLILLEHANEVVTREELQQKLWSADVFVDFDHGLNTVIRKVRRALNDDAEKPRFIETVGRQGYRFVVPVEMDGTASSLPNFRNDETQASDVLVVSAGMPGPESDTRRIRNRRGWTPGRLLGAGLICVTALLLAYLFRPETPTPHISRAVQLTKSGDTWWQEPIYTDGPRVYYQSAGTLASRWQLRQVLLNGNEDSPAGVPPQRFYFRGLSPDDTEFLALLPADARNTVWTVPVSGGSPHRLGDLLADDIAWSHDGAWLVYAQDNHLFLAGPDGASSHALASLPETSGAIERLSWSPDDRRISFTEHGTTTQTLWEVGADGRDLHKLQLNWAGKEMECCGRWTPDGRYFIFASSRQGISNLWALEETSEWWRRRNPEPVQLTFGPVQYNQPLPSRNGRSVFAIGVQPSGELVRYDACRRDFVPFLDGQSIAHLSFSHDGQWMAYVAYPEGTLWRARSDGTEQLQLTFPPLRVGGPRWSADGKQIAFHAKESGQSWKNFVISSAGGTPEPFPAEPWSQTSPGWMPDRDALIYSRAYEAAKEENPALYIFDRGTGLSQKIPGTDGLFGTSWSPDGRYLDAIDPLTNHLFLVDLKSGRRTHIAGPMRWPAWSADSQYIYFVRDGANGIFRVHVPDGKEEKVLSIPFPVTEWPFTVTPDGAIILLRERGRYDVYALSLSPR